MTDAQERVRARFKKTYYVNYGLIFIVLFLLVFGLIMLLSTSSYEANLKYGNAWYFFNRQAGSTAFGLAVMLFISFWPNYKIYKRFTIVAYAGACAAPFLVKTSLAYSANGATRWVRIFGVSVQPAEVSKLLMIIFLAGFVSQLGKQVSTRRGFWITLGMSVVPAFLVYSLTRNLSSALIIVCIAVAMLFVSCPDYRRFIVLGAGTAGIAALAISYAVSSSTDSMNFRFMRILAWLHPEQYASGKGHQTIQALYAIGSGGLFGKGLGESMQKLGFLPEAQNDMIFSIICEELGLFGAIAIMIMFMLLIWRLKLVADSTTDMFGALLVIGVLAHVSIQVILNIAVVTNTIPNTGITLPFISFGGSAVVMQLVEIGIALNVSRISSAEYE
ncbi:cell division protein FtsW [Butyrivibrio fibrisolvens DSM 3071]|jgi:cell division protein FtsW|uniref:Probable peptidoglycan glycosyltransferase FtsW n=1 Tax=Butyrivibrio fibrisolvens DSM 3071 TaxID=1121131 RepID=A0A1M5TTT4_BUTFI|nr:putative peptidoglycan glycosyltransferase FtsW [Butyrivibrio fibrisolvens]SHH54109.1 cell division protein FtsW [Butyrivibrio fibrisolvens DSM 3071]